MSGLQPNQLKWKWPDKLTVDWRIQPAKVSGYYEVYAYFKKKRVGAPGDAGHTQFSRSMRLLNPNQLPLPARGSPEWPIVVECSFDHQTWYWSMERIRADKKDANSIVTIVSVMESIAERLDLKAILEGLQVPTAAMMAMEGEKWLTQHQHQFATAAVKTTTTTPNGGGEAPLPTIVPSDSGKGDDGKKTEGGEVSALEAARTAERKSFNLAAPAPCKLVVRATLEQYRNNIALSLQWVVKLPEVRNVIPCNHRLVADCFGLGQPSAAAEEDKGLTPTSRLAGLLQIAIANAGGCYAWSNVLCDALFDPRTGRWGIVKLYPARSSNEAFHTQALDPCST